MTAGTRRVPPDAARLAAAGLVLAALAVAEAGQAHEVEGHAAGLVKAAESTRSSAR